MEICQGACNFVACSKKPDRMIVVEIKDGETLDKALRRYKKKFEKTRILKEVRRRAYYTKPSVENRERVKRAVRRSQYILENS